MSVWYATETFTDDERAILSAHLTSLDGPVFALVDLPEAVKGALFAHDEIAPAALPGRVRGGRRGERVRVLDGIREGGEAVRPRLRGVWG